MTEEAFVGDCTLQGTTGGALLSQANLDVGLMEYFQDSQDEINYGSVKLQPLAYQDDILKGSKDVLSTQVGNVKLAAMFVDMGLGLEAHPDKTCFIVCGSKKYKQNVMEDLKRNTLMFGNFNIWVPGSGSSW